MSVQIRTLYVPEPTGRARTNRVVNRTLLELRGGSERTKKV